MQRRCSPGLGVRLEALSAAALSRAMHAKPSPASRGLDITEERPSGTKVSGDLKELPQTRLASIPKAILQVLFSGKTTSVAGAGPAGESG